MSPDRPLVLVGAGSMGGAMLEGWLAAGRDPRSIVVLDPAPPASPALHTEGLRVISAAKDDITAHTLVMAVKPQLMGDVGPAVKAMVDDQSMILSVMAGVTVDRLTTLGGGPVIRSIPNTPASVGRGATAAFGFRAQPDHIALADSLLSALGMVRWVDDEALIDSATAVSGSGPAYVFHLVEALAAAGEAEGLPEDVALDLARQTIVGAGALLDRSPLDPGRLRENVTSKGGTTAAALEVLMADDGFPDLLRKAVAAAAARSRELGQ